jgi:hypothetical protein
MPVLLPFGLASFLGRFSYRACGLADCAKVFAVNFCELDEIQASFNSILHLAAPACRYIGMNENEK